VRVYGENKLGKSYGIAQLGEKYPPRLKPFLIF